MGGSVAIAARFNNGDAICIEGWTNYMPWMIINDTTFSGDDSIVRKTLLETVGGEYYGDPLPLRKSGYGIVVIDFITREIHSIQGYCSFGTRWIGQLVEINECRWEGDEFVQPLSKEGKSLVDAGRIYASRMPGEPEEHITTERAVEILKKNAKILRGSEKEEYQSIRINTAPFVVHDYGEDASITPIKARLKETGFPLTRKEGLNAILTQSKE